MSTVNLSYTLDIDCPHCGKVNDLTDQDFEGAYSSHIFNNGWEELVGESVEWDRCEREFIISDVDH